MLWPCWKSNDWYSRSFLHGKRVIRIEGALASMEKEWVNRRVELEQRLVQLRDSL